MYDSKENYVRLPLENSGNVRDLGGYPGADKKVTKFRRFLRSGTLAYLTEDEIRFLLDYGVRTVIDLRTAGEVDKEVNPFSKISEVKYLQIPFIVGDITVIPYEKDNLEAMRDMYIYILTKCAEMVALGISTIANAPEGTVLYHCSAGKDRTGILSYILLELAGVSQADIIANYQITETYYLPLFKKFAPDFDVPIQYLRSQAKDIEQTMEYINKNFGGVEGYLLKNGVSVEDLRKIKRRLLD